jgi:anti-sigma regulatory factor (Ser/Thr protein kinase)
MAWKFTLCVETSVEAFHLVRKVLGTMVDIAGGSEEDAIDAECAVGEALLNAHRHAYQGKPGPLEVQVAYSCEDNALHVLVSDQGPPRETTPQVPTGFPSPPAGWGLYLIGQLMDEVEIVHPARDGRGTTIRMVKVLA